MIIDRIIKAIRVLQGQRLEPVARFSFGSNINQDSVPKNKWTYVSTDIVVDEVGQYWIENTHIIDMKSGKDNNKFFAGKIGQVAVFSKPLHEESKSE